MILYCFRLVHALEDMMGYQDKIRCKVERKNSKLIMSNFFD